MVATNQEKTTRKQTPIRKLGGYMPIIMPRYHCSRCHHSWPPRINAYPKECPRCKNPNWNRDVVEDLTPPKAKHFDKFFCDQCKIHYYRKLSKKEVAEREAKPKQEIDLVEA